MTKSSLKPLMTLAPILTSYLRQVTTITHASWANTRTQLPACAPHGFPCDLSGSVPEGRHPYTYSSCPKP